MIKTAMISGAVCTMLITTITASPASARMLDRVGTTCGQALVTAKFQQEDDEREVDVEVYSRSRGEKWRLEIRDAQGKVLHRMKRTTGRDAAFDVWRYVPLNTTKVDVRVSGPSGQACVITLTSR
jgi:hypothetical protein